MTQYYTPDAAGQPRWRQEFERAFRAFATGDHESAADICRQIEWAEGENPMVIHLLGTSLSYQGEYEQARTELARSLRINPKNPQVLCDIAYTHRMQGHFDESHRFVDQALAILPDYHAALRAKAELLNRAGDAADAYDVLKPAIDQGLDHPNVVLAFGEVCPEVDKADESIQPLKELVVNEAVPQQYRASASFLLGRMYENTGAFDAAWEAYEWGNELTPVPWDPAALDSFVDGLIADLSPDTLRSLPRARRRTDMPVFIVGFPRSGTTLVEQILSCHPDVFAAGERSLIPRMSRADPVQTLTQPAADAAGDEYMSQLLSFAPDGIKRFTDKNPGNYFHLAFIGSILPGARIVLCTRDPLDTCVSCFAQDFAHRQPYSRDLTWLGRAYNAYRRMIDHYQRTLEVPIHTVNYEALIADREAVTRELIEFVGLDFVDACLQPHKSNRAALTASFAQVRRPVYSTSVGRAERFARHLAPLRKALDHT